MLALGSGCGEAFVQPDGGDSCDTGEVLRFEVTLTAIGVEDADGFVEGMNLDGRASDRFDDDGCNQEDWTAPDGTEGIDNQLAALVVTTTGGPRPVLTDHDPITLEIGSFDGLDDGCVRWSVNGETPIEGTLFGGRFEEQGEGTIAFAIGEEGAELDVLSLPMHGLAARGRLTSEGELTELVVGGRMDIDRSVERVHELAPDVDPSLIRTTFEGVADLDRDAEGLCQSVSAGFVATARRL